jgi:hypothetical protein
MSAAPSKPAISILDACRDPNLFAPWFLRRGDWTAWFAFLGALFNLPLDRKQQRIFKQCTRRSLAPASPFNEAWLVVPPPI